MKSFLFISCFMFLSVSFSNAQKWAPVDQSPLDQIYFPANYPSLKVKGTKEPLRMRIIYSRPNKNNRPIFGSQIVPYGKVWRLGANEATELELFTDARVGGKKVEAGRYTLYALVNEKSWTFIVNKETDTWGAFKYDPAKDVCRVTAAVESLDQALEALTINLQKTDKGVNLVAGWDQVAATLPISF
ncbi:DUF2911 domain-containing protein [Niabella insulamsoli]|uniref:DUF2911 domain-containing protein n=1 Tax=Niabella insulamsoli TaxID=3144874 RepID=UPI0031FCDE39